MAKAPSGTSSVNFDGAGNVWFKVYQITANADPAGVNYPTFPALSKYLPIQLLDHLPYAEPSDVP